MRPLIARLLMLCAMLLPFESFAADTRVGWETQHGLTLGETATLRWDVHQGDGTVIRGTAFVFNFNLSPMSSEDVALNIARQIDATLVAASSDTTIEGNGNFYFAISNAGTPAVSMRTGTTDGGFKLVAEETLFGSLNIAPDPATGLAALIEDGNFSVDLDGVARSFTARAGTTNSELALLFGSNLHSLGFDVDVEGGMVKYSTHQAGRVSFQTDGDGLEYVISSVPEPAGLILMLTGLLAACALTPRRVGGRRDVFALA